MILGGNTCASSVYKVLVTKKSVNFIFNFFATLFKKLFLQRYSVDLFKKVAN